MWMQENEKRCFLYCVPNEARNGQNVALIKEVNIAWIEEVTNWCARERDLWRSGLCM